MRTRKQGDIALLDAGASAQLRNADRTAPIDVARARGHTAAIALLERR